MGALIGLRDIFFSGLVFGEVAQAFFNNSIRVPISNLNGIFGSHTHTTKAAAAAATTTTTKQARLSQGEGEAERLGSKSLGQL